MALAFARAGAQLALCDVNGDAVRDTATSASNLGAATPTAAVVDVADGAAVTAWVADTRRQFGSCDVLVNSAGIIRDSRIETMTDEAWEAVVGVNLTGTFNCARAVVPYMKQQSYGRILSLSSMSWRGNFGQANYSAAKAGVVGLTRTIALEVAAFGITCNAIAPGLIATPMLATMNAQARQKLTNRVPVGKIGVPADISAAALYLCSEPAGYVTGVVLDVDGGIGVGASIR